MCHRDGTYAGFDRSAPTSSDGGKARVVAALQASLGPDAVPIVMVGDGATDMQVRHTPTNPSLCITNTALPIPASASSRRVPPRTPS